MQPGWGSSAGVRVNKQESFIGKKNHGASRAQEMRTVLLYLPHIPRVSADPHKTPAFPELLHCQGSAHIDWG